jgi:hypothetical protein
LEALSIEDRGSRHELRRESGTRRESGLPNERAITNQQSPINK